MAVCTAEIASKTDIDLENTQLVIAYNLRAVIFNAMFKRVHTSTLFPFCSSMQNIIPASGQIRKNPLGLGKIARYPDSIFALSLLILYNK